MALNVKSLFYSAYIIQSPRNCLSDMTCTVTSGLTELLQKDATALDPGRVVNISSVASKDPIAQDTALASKGQGLWSCTFKSIGGFIISGIGTH